MALSSTKALAAACLAGRAAALSVAKLRGAEVALVPAEAAAGVANIGSKDCPCIGLKGLNGTAAVNFDGVYVDYPVDVGSYCAPWDDGRDKNSCLEGQDPGKGNGFCGQSWCFVDACSCAGLDQPPAMSRYMRSIFYQGRPLYYSYATCGSQDTWTAKKNDIACVNAKTEEACTAAGDNCLWGDTPGGQKCMAWEAGGLCMDLPEVSDWGQSKCPCVGFTGLNGTVWHDGDSYPGEMGSVCKKWDADHSHHCSGDQKAEWCAEPWCFVDPTNCNIEAKPIKSSYFPEATSMGHSLHYSYETCGGKRPKETTTTTTTTTATTATAAIEETTTAAATAEAAAADATEEQAPTEAPESKAEEPEEAKDQPEETTPTTTRRIRARNSGMGFDYDHEAYGEEWHDEWRTGKVPSFKEIQEQRDE